MILPIYILAITNIPKVGRKTAIKLIRGFDRALETDEDFFSFVEFVESKHPGKTKEWDAGKALESANLCLENSSLHGISITTYWDNDYPELLKITDDPPVMLHHKGNLKCLNETRLGPPGLIWFYSRQLTECHQRSDLHPWRHWIDGF